MSHLDWHFLNQTASTQQIKENQQNFWLHAHSWCHQGSTDCFWTMQLVQLRSLNYIFVCITFAMKNVCWYQDLNQQICALENTHITLLPCCLSCEWIWIFQCSVVFVSALQSNLIASQKVMNFKLHIQSRQLSDVGNFNDWKTDKRHTLDKRREITNWRQLYAYITEPLDFGCPEFRDGKPFWALMACDEKGF